MSRRGAVRHFAHPECVQHRELAGGEHDVRAIDGYEYDCGNSRRFFSSGDRTQRLGLVGDR